MPAVHCGATCGTWIPYAPNNIKWWRRNAWWPSNASVPIKAWSTPSTFGSIMTLVSYEQYYIAA